MNSMQMNALLDDDRETMATMILNPFLVETFMLTLSTQFNSSATHHIEGTIQFYFSGEVDGSCHVIVENGFIEPKTGVAEKANLIVGGPYGLWSDIVSGKADPYEMIIKGRIQALCDMSLMQIFVR